MPGKKQSSLRLKLVRFLAALDEMQTLQGQRYPVSSAGFGHLFPRITFGGSADLFVSGLLDVFALEGQDQLVVFLRGLEPVLLPGTEGTGSS